MNILIVNYEYPPLGGGGGIATRDIAHVLAEHHTVHVLTSSVPGLLNEEKATDRDLTIFRAPVFQRSARAVASIVSMMAFIPSGIRLGAQLMRSHSYDVINTWFAIPSGPVGAYLSRHFHCPHQLTVVGGDIYDPSKWYSPHRTPGLRFIVKKVLKQAHSHAAISKDIASRAKEYYRFDRHIEVIPLGIRSPSFPYASRNELGLDEQKFYLITIGRLVRRKNFPKLIEAVGLLKSKEVELLVVGDGPELQHLQNEVRRWKIEKQVHFLGFVEEEMKYQLLSNSNVFVLPSLHEGFGLVYVEAMSCGLPIVAACTGGQQEFLQDGKTGFLIPSDDSRALKNAIATLCDDEELRHSIGQNNSTLAKDYSVERTAGKFHSLFEKTIQAGSAFPKSLIPSEARGKDQR